MSWLSKAYKKSGLRSIYEKNKSAILTGGLFGPAASLGFIRDRKKSAQQKITNQRVAGAQEQARRIDNLDDFLGGITDGPGLPPGVVTGQPVGYNNQFSPSNPTGGIATGGGEAINDQNRLLAEAELQKKLQTEAATGNESKRRQMLQEYADLISAQQNRILDENAPGIYEDLNRRGLLRSSELGNTFARERGKAASILGEQVGLQGLTDREAALREASGINDQYYQGRYGAIQRGMSLEDFARQTKAAQLTGQALAPIPQPTKSAKGGSALQGGLGGATIGANFGPAAAAVGGIGGTVLGGQLGSK